MSWGAGQSKEPYSSLLSDKRVFFCNMNNWGVGLDFHRLKSSEGDAAVPSGVCVCAGSDTHTHTCPRACWELGQDGGPWMNCVLSCTDHLATDGDG